MLEGGLESTVHHGGTHNLQPQVSAVRWRSVCPTPLCTGWCLCGVHFPRPLGWLVTPQEHQQRVGWGPARGTQGSPLIAPARLGGKSCSWLPYSLMSAPLPSCCSHPLNEHGLPERKCQRRGSWPFSYLWVGWGIWGRQLNLKIIFYMKS